MRKKIIRAELILSATLVIVTSFMLGRAIKHSGTELHLAACMLENNLYTFELLIPSHVDKEWFSEDFCKAITVHEPTK